MAFIEGDWGSSQGESGGLSTGNFLGSWAGSRARENAQTRIKRMQSFRRDGRWLRAIPNNSNHAVFALLRLRNCNCRLTGTSFHGYSPVQQPREAAHIPNQSNQGPDEAPPLANLTGNGLPSNQGLSSALLLQSGSTTSPNKGWNSKVWADQVKGIGAVEAGTRSTANSSDFFLGVRSIIEPGGQLVISVPLFSRAR